jgi:hypothetical protein
MVLRQASESLSFGPSSLLFQFVNDICGAVLFLELLQSPSVALRHSLSLSHSPSHSLTLILSLSLSHSPSHSLTFTHSPSRSLSLSLTLPLAHSPSHSLTPSLPHSPSPTHSLTHSLQDTKIRIRERASAFGRSVMRTLGRKAGEQRTPDALPINVEGPARRCVPRVDCIRLQANNPVANALLVRFLCSYDPGRALIGLQGWHARAGCSCDCPGARRSKEEEFCAR